MSSRVLDLSCQACPYSCRDDNNESNCQRQVRPTDILVEPIQTRVFGAISTGLREILRTELSSSLQSQVGSVPPAAFNYNSLDAIPVDKVDEEEYTQAWKESGGMLSCLSSQNHRLSHIWCLLQLGEMENANPVLTQMHYPLQNLMDQVGGVICVDLAAFLLFES
jgi:hypothetical protein